MRRITEKKSSELKDVIFRSYRNYKTNPVKRDWFCNLETIYIFRAREESDLDLEFRKLMLYPLNYGRIVIVQE